MESPSCLCHTRPTYAQKPNIVKLTINTTNPPTPSVASLKRQKSFSLRSRIPVASPIKLTGKGGLSAVALICSNSRIHAVNDAAPSVPFRISIRSTTSECNPFFDDAIPTPIFHDDNNDTESEEGDLSAPEDHRDEEWLVSINTLERLRTPSTDKRNVSNSASFKTREMMQLSSDSDDEPHIRKPLSSYIADRSSYESMATLVDRSSTAFKDDADETACSAYANAADFKAINTTIVNTESEPHTPPSFQDATNTIRLDNLNLQINLRERLAILKMKVSQLGDKCSQLALELNK
ncbi:hypothetical protein BJ741DRAFT_577028 [Chytriomyces cf. hyalinus JEL632]|nr:hypothetical protein BJ741DRAFT_577028 [Chytriomyces cf. hyalinus JEL632]